MRRAPSVYVRFVRLLLVHACAPGDERWRKPLGPRGAAVEAWHRLLAARTLDVAAAVEADVRLVTPGRIVEWHALASRARNPRLTVELDGAGTTDERRQAAFDRAFADGYDEVLLISADVPELSASRVALAFDALGAGDAAVIGPAVDGGVYLVGATRAATLERRAAGLAAAWSNAGRRVTLLPPLADVDSLADAAALAARLRRSGSLLLRAALADLLGGDALPLYDAFRAFSALDALAAAPTVH
jgi:glycosyltransferase A (GT-A) superfamily protein (DUF2064 family)